MNTDEIKDVFKVPRYPFTYMFKVHEESFESSYSTEGSYCLRTPANKNPKCRNCGLCPDKEFKKNTLQREYTVTSENDLYIPKPKIKCIYRIVVRINEELKYQKKVVLCHFIAGKIISINDNYLASLLKVNPVSVLGWKNKLNTYSGYLSFDMEFSEEVHLKFPDLSSLGIHFSDCRCFNLGCLPTELISIFTYHFSLALVPKTYEKLKKFFRNPIYSKTIVDRAGDKVIKIRYPYSKNISLLKDGKGILVFPVKSEQPIELLKSILRCTSTDIILNGSLSCIGLFLEPKEPSICKNHKLPLLNSVFNEQEHQCVGCILGTNNE